ncbi:hypothetical protein, partial [Microbacterium sp. K24]|uniref:hypothetical protein n=1 Tax=Microbacterium sp. K24 TaxID=2305446 RepID=UPI00197BDE56
VLEVRARREVTDSHRVELIDTGYHPLYLLVYGVSTTVGSALGGRFAEQRAEQRRRVEAGKAEPVDAPLTRLSNHTGSLPEIRDLGRGDRPGRRL